MYTRARENFIKEDRTKSKPIPAEKLNAHVHICKSMTRCQMKTQFWLVESHIIIITFPPDTVKHLPDDGFFSLFVCVKTHTCSGAAVVIFPFSRQRFRDAPAVPGAACKHNSMPVLSRTSRWDVYSKYYKSQRQIAF